MGQQWEADDEEKATAGDGVVGLGGAVNGEEQVPLLHRFGTTGFQHASPFSKATYAFVGPLVKLGWRNKIDDHSAAGYLPQADTAEVLSAQFDAAYAEVKAEQERRGRRCSPSGLMWRTYWRLYKWRVLVHLLWTMAEIADRVGAPLVLRQLLTWLSGWEVSDGNSELYPTWRGWMWAGVLGAFGYIYCIVHHQLFWYGMRMGFDMRQQAVAAVQAKVLRLNSVAVADQTAGKIVNLISNDVRRFDDALPFYNFVLLAPVELVIVFVLVGLRLGFWASLAGVSTLVALIPAQGMLVRYIGRLRACTAAQTDERVRLTGEVISGMLASKMLGWEQPFMEQIGAIRRQEASFIRRTARIKAFNMGLSYSITPLSALAAFGVARATSSDQLTVPNLFYSLALLALPKIYMCDFFVLGVGALSELRVSMHRLGDFLSLPEPPEPWHAQQAQQANKAHGGHGRRSACSDKACGDSDHSRRRTGSDKGTKGAYHPEESTAPNGHACLPAAVVGADGMVVPGVPVAGGKEAPLPAVEVAGVDFDWADRSWAQQSGGGCFGSSGGDGDGDGSPASTAAAAKAVAQGTTQETGTQAAATAALAPAAMATAEAEAAAAAAARPADMQNSAAAAQRGRHAQRSAVRAANGDASTGPTATTLGIEANGTAAAAASSAAALTAAAAPAAFQLRGLRFSVERGQLVAIVGAVGSGKSSVLAALLGELQPTRQRRQPAAARDIPAGPSSGRYSHCTAASPVAVRGSVAYCSQVPWIVSGTIKENVLFGRQYDAKLYNAVLEACALEDDVAALPAGDDTELGERGINLSGGQKARLALARASYSQADIQLLDDPLSAVDPRVGRLLFDRCIGNTGLMAGSTRLLVTHQRQFLPGCDEILVLRGGTITHRGTYAELASAGVPEVIATHETSLDDASYEANAAPVAPAQAPSSGNSGAAAGDSGITSASIEEFGQREQQQRQRQQLGQQRRQTEQQQQPESQSGQQQQQQQQQCVPADSSHTAVNGQSDGHTQHANQAQHAEQAPAGSGKRMQYDRTVSLLFSDSAAAGLGGSHVSGSGADSARSAHGSSGTMRSGGAARWRQKRSGSYVRRTVSARFAGGTRHGRGAGGVEGGDGSEEEKGSPPGSNEAGAASGKGELKRGKSGRLIVVEDQAVGSVAWGVYGRYAQRMGLHVVALITAGLLLGQATYLFGDYWLSLWASREGEEQRELYWIWAYAIMVGAILLISFSRSLLFFMAALRASTQLHEDMVQRVLRAPLSFFHTSPTGRILNRFSKDQGQVDEQLPQVFYDCALALMMVLGAFVLLMVSVPFIIPVFLPLGAAFFYVRARYLRTSREVKRWEATSRSPVFASFSAILKGLPTIRAYGAGPRFRSEFLQQLSDNGAWWFVFLTTARWIGFRLDLLVSLLMTAAPLLMMAVHDRLSSRLAGLALTQSLQLAGMLQWMVRQSAEVENNMTSVERMLHYTQLDQEPPMLAEGGAKPPPGWPSAGKIEYRHVTAVYRPGLPPVLQDINFTLEGGVSCGVVGRTGSGKSSLMLTLFRLIPVTSGTILIDGVDTAGIALDALRRQIAIIPQDPVLFSGTLRTNLDPWGAFDDGRLWEALHAAQLSAAVAALGGLDTRMQEAGDNLSVGQRQLFALARALLQDAAVVALDEATANVDRQTDALIQKAVRECTSSGERRRTLLVIAHRIDTIMDCDQLVVLSAGRLVEQGAPGELAQSGGMFARLVAAARASGALQPPLPPQPLD